MFVQNDACFMAIQLPVLRARKFKLNNNNNNDNDGWDTKRNTLLNKKITLKIYIQLLIKLVICRLKLLHSGQAGQQRRQANAAVVVAAAGHQPSAIGYKLAAKKTLSTLHASGSHCSLADIATIDTAISFSQIVRLLSCAEQLALR